MAKYKIGICGFGKIARDQHAAAIEASADFELSAVCNIGLGSPPPNVQGFATLDDMLGALPELDAVSFCTPPAPRRALAVKALEAGKHVLLEKPPAATVAEVSAIAASANSLGKVMFGTYHAQHNEAVKMAAAALVGKEVTNLAVTWKEDIRKWHPGQDWILAEGGFGIFDPGINALSILTRILPSPLFIHSANLFIPANRQAPIAADLVFQSGNSGDQALSAKFDWRWSGEEIWEIDVASSDGQQLKLSDGGAKLEVNGEEHTAGCDGEYPDIYREFAKLIETRQSKADIAPFQLVADAFMIGSHTVVDAFSF